MSKRKTKNDDMFNETMTIVQRDAIVAKLIDALRDSNSNANRALSKKIRRKLRALHHKGGLNERNVIDDVIV